MRKGCVKLSALMTILAVTLTGCGGSFPDMTDEESQIVGEYAANILLKYDAGNRSRLVSREEVAAREARQEEEITIPESTQTMDPVEETPIIEIGQETNNDVTTGSLEEFYGLPDGVSIVYQGNEVRSSYSQDGEMSDYFTLDASEGKQLLVLKFRIENQSQTDQALDLLSRSTIIRTSVNGSNNYSVLTTMLMNDMSTYVGTVPAGAGVDVVLLAEIDSEISSSISTLNLKLKDDAKAYTIQLQ